MSRDNSADPFSAFLNATNRRTSDGRAPDGSARSTDPLPPVVMAVLFALHGRPVRAVGELRVEFGLTTMQIAHVVAMLVHLELVECVPAGGDEALKLTDAGRKLIQEAQ
ncbi:hypothetical protein ABZS79_02380 [Streptomyces griseoloalbus]|uniref:hypothetical protein n=1 Tax=Streptomyces griseoloalbus TaxID=67303 RepID=UPI0033BC47BE